ncbi:cation-translocating P-type ATPase [Methanobrevibacter sp. TMH8]|uniref:heavy metal translocating P-type ATPase n=1 Tax=Methanobrevibacter sp. TMH8 TaxID=2848611 RepID=UPI001CCFEC26|nr:cation-translocating P-type ATPase [Methanobrevibacter sp. TMH8]MBZ9570977.1 cation-translocating P-type ATPase [Methanobrevibacter sp. TMH8]
MNLKNKNNRLIEEENCDCKEENSKEENCSCENKPIEEKSCGCEDEPDNEESCGCEDEPIKEEDCGCEHDHDEHQGCGCEQGLLENIDKIEEKDTKKPLIILGIGVIIFLIGYFVSTLSFNLGNIFNQDLISQLIYLIVVVIVGQGIIRYGIKSLLKKEVKIELLMTIATIGAFLLGDGGEGASLILLFFLAEYLENYSLDRSKRSLSTLVKLSPDIATVKRNVENKTKEIEVNVKDLSIGDIVIVKPGDKIPIDGVIVKGMTSVNQSSITGESLAATKSKGDEVYASTINEDGYIEIEVRKKSSETIFSKIIDLIKESEEKKAKIDLFVDKFAKYYTPSIIILAMFVAIIPPLLFGQNINEWVYRALVLLVISCPCAIAISTPVSIVSAITAGTKNGIIIKGGEYIEELAKIKAIMFDKTGTLTEGKLEITNVSSINDFSENEVIGIASILEKKSKHPIAKAFDDYIKNKNIDTDNTENNTYLEEKEVHNFQSIAGKGLTAEINGETFYVGKKELFDFNDNLKNDIDSYYSSYNDYNNNSDKSDKSNNFDSIGKTSVIVGTENKILGFISLSDKIRENGPETIKSLKEKSIETIMLTGDNSATAKTVAENLNLDNYYPNLLPEDKVNIVEEVAKEYKDVAMVGDGVNDTPSLARANVGIAMGMDGADVAVETADIVLMQDNLSKVDYLINLAKKTMKVIKQNIAIPLTIKAILAILGVIGYVSLWEAILIGDMGLTLLVVANALRIGNN